MSDKMPKRPDCLEWRVPLTSKQARNRLATAGFVAVELRDAQLRERDDRIAALEAKLAEAEAVIAKHNAKMDAVPSLGNASPSMPAGLRFLAKWFDALYGDAGTGQDTVQLDLRRWADEYDTTMNDLHTFMSGHRKFVAEDGYCGMTDTINPLPEWMLAFNRLHEQAEAAKEARDAT